MVKTSPFNAGVTSSIPGQGVAAAAAAKSLQSCPTLCDPVDGSPRGSPVPGILQARTLEWVAISFSMLGAYIFTIVMSSSWIDPLIIM